MKHTLTRVIALVLALLMVMPCITSCRKKSPLETIEDAYKVSAKAYAKNALGRMLAEDLFFGGSMEMRVEAGPYLGMLMGSPNSSLAPGASLKYYYDMANGKAALAAKLSSAGVSVADALLYLADNSVSLSSTALFGSGVYGFSLENFAQNFNNSEFGENGAYSLGISPAEIETTLKSFFQSSKEMMADTAKYTKEMEDAAKALKKDLYPLVESYGVITTEKGSLDVGGTAYATKDLGFAYTGEQLVDMLSATLTLLRDHEATRTYLAAVADTCTTYYSEEYVALVEELFEVEELNADTLHQSLTDSINTLLAELASAKEVIADAHITLRVHIADKTKEIIGLSVSVTEEDNYADFRLVCGPSIVDIDEVGMYAKIYTADVKELEEYSCAYTVTRDDEEMYTAVLNVAGDGLEDVLGGTNGSLAKLEWNKQDGAYLLSVTVEGETIGIGGKYLEEKDSLTMTVTTLSAQGVSVNLGEIALIISAKDTMPENGAYTDILKMDEAALDDLFSEVTTAIEQIASTVGEWLNE